MLSAGTILYKIRSTQTGRTISVHADNEEQAIRHAKRILRKRLKEMGRGQQPVYEFKILEARRLTNPADFPSVKDPAKDFMPRGCNIYKFLSRETYRHVTVWANDIYQAELRATTRLKIRLKRYGIPLPANHRFELLWAYGPDEHTPIDKDTWNRMVDEW
jgi:hypothetical protein